MKQAIKFNVDLHVARPLRPATKIFLQESIARLMNQVDNPATKKLRIGSMDIKLGIGYSVVTELFSDKGTCFFTLKLASAGIEQRFDWKTENKGEIDLLTSTSYDTIARFILQFYAAEYYDFLYMVEDRIKAGFLTPVK